MLIFVKVPNGPAVSVDVELSDSIQLVKDKVIGIVSKLSLCLYSYFSFRQAGNRTKAFQSSLCRQEAREWLPSRLRHQEGIHSALR
jgi:hypothetical protein